MDLIAAALLGIIQGLTEFLPVSSTAHLLLAEQVFRLRDPAFIVIIQFGSILAVMWLYRQKILSVIRGLPSDPDAQRFALMLIVAVLPAVVTGVFLEPFVTGVLHQSMGVIAWAFILGGVAMLVIERRRPAPVVFQADRTPIGRAFALGAIQTLAMIPGISRSGATIIGGLLLRLDRPAAAEFSFFLAMPTRAGAFVFELSKVRNELVVERAAGLAVGFVMAFVAALLVVRPFLRYVSRSGFAPFAWYRIAAGIAILGALAMGWL